VFKEAIDRHPEGMAPIIQKMEQHTMMKRLRLTEDIANVAVFLSSEMAGR
jgi:enoyl-[acyl-carrier-protein] reductase (NADH)